MSHSLDSQPSVAARLQQFFFAKEVPYGLALVRICLPLALLIPMIPRWFRARELYSSDGATTQLSMLYGIRDMLPELPGTAVAALFSVLIVSLFCMALGWKARTSTIIATVLYTYFNMLDSTGTLTKYSAIATNALIAMCFANSGAIWSVDAWLRGNSQAGAVKWPGDSSHLERAEIWPARLVQLLIGIVYFGAAITKLQTPTFFSGDQLRYWIHTHVNYSHSIGELLMLFPAAFVAFAYITVVWEILFVFLVWRRLGKAWMLGLGVMFHFGTCLILGLYVFPLVCCSLYLAFVNERDVQSFAAAFRRWRRRQSWMKARKPTAVVQPNPALAMLKDRLRLPASLLYAGLFVGVAMVSIEAEHYIDPYGMNRPEGPHELKPMDDAVVREMLTASSQIRNKDKIFSFDVGSVVVAGILSNKRAAFHSDEVAVAQVCMNPPFEDIWIQCDVHTKDGNLVRQDGFVVTREQMRVDFMYDLRQWEPGDYIAVLKARGEPVGQRAFSVLPSDRNVQAAN